MDKVDTCECCGKTLPLPCPFCTGEASILTLEFDTPPGRRTFVVGCEACGAEVTGAEWTREGKGEPGFATAEAAVEAWNLRGGRPGGRLDG